MADCPGDATLALLVEGGLDQQPRGVVVAHLDVCSSCRALVADVLSTGGAPAATVPSATADPPASGSTLAGRYLLGAVLGRGGMGVVYEAVQLDLARRVAVKVLASSADPTSTTRFAREARTLAQLAHPNIVQIFDYGVDAGVAFVVMERLEGRSLAEALRADTRLDVATSVQIASEVLVALGVTHAASVVHRDIKPGNIFLVTSGSGKPPRVKLLDFGIAATDDGASSLTETGTAVGTPAYMAPEQLLGGAVDARSDLHAVGVCVFEMLTGSRPFVAASRNAMIAEIVLGNARRADTAAPDVPAALADVVARALARDPQKRYASAQAMADALAPFAGTLPAAAAAPRPATPASHARSWILLLVGAVAAIVIARMVLSKLPDPRSAAPVSSVAVPSPPVLVVTNEEAGAAPSATVTMEPTASSRPLPPPERRVPSICVASDGSFVCPARLADSCDTQVARLNPTLAIPGTPCTGVPERGFSATSGVFRAKQ